MAETMNPGKFFIFGFEGVNPPENFLSLLESYPPAGIVFLERNYRSPERLEKLIARLRSSIGPDTIFSADQEPGRVQRFKAGFPESRLPHEYLENSSADDYFNWCERTAAILSDIGINLNLAPVVDMTPRDRSSTVLSGRSFGGDVEKVVEYSEILIDAHKKYDVLTCAKHFPGLGSASEDPHERLSVSNGDEEEFVNYHWKPFEAAARRGVDLMMTTHLSAGSLDRDTPATYSPKIISMIREKVGFSGPVISDDLLMTGAGDYANIGSAAVSSLSAGHSIVIVSSDVSAQRKALEGVAGRYESDESFREKLNLSEKTIRKIKKKISAR